MQARILNQLEERLWSEFVQNHPLGNIHQTPEWGHFQSKIPGRRKYWIVVIEEKLTPGGQAEHGLKTMQDADNTVSKHSSTKILAGTLLVRHSLPGGYCWLYAPRGPLLNDDSQMSTLLEKIKKIAKYEKAIFLRVDPLSQTSASPSSLTELRPDNCLTNYQPKSAYADFLPKKMAQESHPVSNTSPLHFSHFRQNMTGFQPDHTLVLDLTKSESEILAQMKPKGRYNIKLAEKKGVKIIRSNPGRLRVARPGSDATAPSATSPTNSTPSSDLSKFYQILTETTSRDGFHGHDQEFYMNMLKELNHTFPPTPNEATSESTLSTSPACAPARPPTQSPDPACVTDLATLYLAEYEGEIIAGALNTFYKDTATYYYGASSNAHRNVMAPYLLHWHAILDAKANGYKTYDFFGISPSTGEFGQPPARPHPWAGVTEFKKKFGGTEISYQKPQEFIFKKALYHLYRIYKNLRKK